MIVRQTETSLLERFGEQFGIGRVEGKQLVPGATGTNWEIDAKAFQSEGAGFLIVECRRYTTSRLDQESLGALAYRIRDTGAAGGILVSPLGIQEGAARVARAEGIRSLRLTPTSSTTDYVLEFLNQTFIGVAEKVAFENRLQQSICAMVRWLPKSEHRTLGSWRYRN
jgi:hypothetical protein